MVVVVRGMDLTALDLRHRHLLDKGPKICIDGSQGSESGEARCEGVPHSGIPSKDEAHFEENVTECTRRHVSDRFAIGIKVVHLGHWLIEIR